MNKKETEYLFMVTGTKFREFIRVRSPRAVHISCCFLTIYFTFCHPQAFFKIDMGNPGSKW